MGIPTPTPTKSSNDDSDVVSFANFSAVEALCLDAGSTLLCVHRHVVAVRAGWLDRHEHAAAWCDPSFIPRRQ